MRKLTRLFALMLALTMLLGALPALAEEPANPSGIPYYKVTSDLYDFIDMDGAPIRSCSTPVDSVGAGKIVTIEGVGASAVGAKVQAAWTELDVAQCGYCQAGMIMAVSALLDGAMKDPMAMGWPQSVGLQPDLELSRLVPQTRLHTGLLGALALAVALWALMARTVTGFRIRAVGANARAAAFAGVPVTRTLVLVALLSGGLAGLAGAIEVAGRTGYVTLDMSPGYGYSGIVIAMLAGLNPMGVVAAAVFVAGVLVGADSMSRAVGVPTYLADVIVAISLLSVLVATLFTQYRVKR